MSVKLAPVKVCENWSRNGLLDEVIDCSQVNAINVQVTVNGTNPSAVISVEGAATGDYMPLPDLNASQTVTADTAFDVVVGTRLARIRIASISGTFPQGSGFTIWVTRYISPGSARVAASIVVDTLAAIQVLTGALTLSGVCSIGADGGIYQGTGTFASPTTGLKIWRESGVGKIAGYNGGVVQWYADTDGKFYAGAGFVKLDAGGLHVGSLPAQGGYIRMTFDQAITWRNEGNTGDVDGISVSAGNWLKLGTGLNCNNQIIKNGSLQDILLSNSFNGNNQSIYNVRNLLVNQGIGVHGASAPTSQPTVTGSRTDGSALLSLLTALAAAGHILDSSTA